MQRMTQAGLALLLMLTVSGVPALAQTPSTDIKIEQKKQRTIVKPPADAGAAASDAEAAAGKLDEQRRVEELRKKAMEPPAAPPLDESVVEGSRGKQLQELPKR